MSCADLTVTVWKKYGKHRLYVNDADGERIGWRDVATGADTIERPDRTDDFHAVIAQHLGAPPDGPILTATAPEAATAAPPELPAAATPRIAGVGGTSAQREYERRSARERGRKEAEVAEDRARRERLKAERPVLGLLAAALTPKPNVGPESQPTAAWAVGAVGERVVATALEGCDGVFVLHDRRKPGSRANIDHIAVAAAGIFVIDAKNYDGGVEVRDVGGWLRADERLFVRGRDRTKLVKDVAAQVDVLRGVLPDDAAAIPITPVLCFVGGEWPLFQRKGLRLGEVRICPPRALPALIGGPGSLDRDRRALLAATIAAALPEA